MHTHYHETDHFSEEADAKEVISCRSQFCFCRSPAEEQEIQNVNMEVYSLLSLYKEAQH